MPKMKKLPLRLLAAHSWWRKFVLPIRNFSVELTFFEGTTCFHVIYEQTVPRYGSIITLVSVMMQIRVCSRKTQSLLTQSCQIITFGD